jgi:hypothetical protein
VRSPLKLATLLLLASTLDLACSSDTHVIVARAPGVDLGEAHVSVFGVYSDGRWNVGAWEKLAPRLTSLGADRCETGFGEALRTADHALFDAIDREARATGVSDEMVAQVAPSAKGDMVLVLELWGALGTIPTNTPSTGAPTTGGMGGAGMGGAGMGGPGMGGMGGGRMRPPGAGGYGLGAKQQDELEMLARVFSLETNEWVGAVEVRYSGSDPNEAVARFDQSLAELLPAAHCSGWSWKAPVSSSPSSSTSSTSSPPSTSASVPNP